MYDEGISAVGSLLDLALEHGILLKRGSWFSYKGEQLGQGRDATKDALKEDKKMYAEIEQLVKNALSGHEEEEEESIEF
jgi:recombination protein RecA